MPLTVSAPVSGRPCSVYQAASSSRSESASSVSTTATLPSLTVARRPRSLLTEVRFDLCQRDFSTFFGACQPFDDRAKEGPLVLRLLVLSEGLDNCDSATTRGQEHRPAGLRNLAYNGSRIHLDVAERHDILRESD